MRPAGALLARALQRRGACLIVAADEWPWASVTFTGARHRLRLVIAAAAAERFLDGIEEAEFDLGEHLLADLVVTDRITDGDEAVIAIEALTIENDDVMPRCDAAYGQGEPLRRTRCGTKRAFAPLAGT